MGGLTYAASGATSALGVVGLCKTAFSVSDSHFATDLEQTCYSLETAKLSTCEPEASLLCVSLLTSNRLGNSCCQFHHTNGLIWVSVSALDYLWSVLPGTIVS